jgi:hypothetical protein
MPAISPGPVPPPEPEPDVPAAVRRGTVVEVGDVLVVGVDVLDVGVGVLDVGVARKATTLLEEGARRSPSPMLGVGK